MSTLQGNTNTIENLLRSVNNLPNVGADDAVLYIDQTLTEAQKAQARTNIGAASEEEVAGKMDKVTGTEDQVIGFDADGDPVAREAPSGGGVSSWNDLTDKPVVSEGSPDTLTWDGNTEGLVSVDMTAMVGAKFYKVSDVVLVDADFANGGDYVFSNGNSGSIEVTTVADGVLSAPEFAFICVAENAVGVDVAGVTFPEAGLYLAAYAGRYTAVVAIVNYTGFPVQEKIAPSYLYQPDWNQTDETAADFIKNKPFGEETVMGDTLTWDGNTEGRVVVDLSDTVGFPLYHVHISDATPSFDDVAGGAVVVTITGSERTTNEISPENINQLPDAMSIDAFTVVFLDNTTVSVEGMEMFFPKAGVYANLADASSLGGAKTQAYSLTIPGYTGFANTEIKQIDSKYLPDVADIPAAWIADLKAALGIA